jgi:hypothetical protein
VFHPNGVQVRKLSIISGEVTATAALEANETAEAIWNELPIEGHANTWGDEIYFSIPVQVKPAKDARDAVEIGELGYWPPGNAFCIFFGKTPASHGSEPRAASPVNIFGRIEGDATVFKKVKGGAKVKIERA